MVSIETILLLAACLLILSVLASKASGKLGVPSLVLFLVIGMLAGSDGPGRIHFDDAYLAQSLGVVALVIILFSGGLATNYKKIRPVIWQGLSLSTLGVLFTAVLVGLFSTYVLGFSAKEGMLLGAIVSSTDAAAVFTVLRSSNVSLKRRTKDLLELESGSNDPMSVFLTTVIIQMLTNPGDGFLDYVPDFFLQMLVGGAVGYGLGRLGVHLLNRIKLEFEGLYLVLVLGWIALVYGLSDYLRGNGFLSVYVAGFVMGNRQFIFKTSIVRFQDGLAWLMQIVMFLVLGLLVYPHRLGGIVGIGSLSAVFLIFIARPVGINLALLFSRVSWRERLLLSWVGLRGAVPIILATFPLLAHVEKSDMIFNMVFFIVLASVLLQGTTIPIVAKWLGLNEPFTAETTARFEFNRPEGSNVDLVELIVPYQSKAAEKSVVNLNLPPEALIILICRGDNYIVPRGGTVLEAGDVVVCLVAPENLESLKEILNPG